VSWFIKDEFPKVLSDLKKDLEEILQFITNPKLLDNPDLNDCNDNNAIAFKHPSDKLFGSLTLDGWTISEADICIRSDVGRNTTKAKIESRNPWRLEQIQSIYYYCRESLGELEDFLAYFPAEEVDLNTTSRILDILLDKLMNAKEQLLPGNFSVESVLPNKKYFKNNLPDDLVMDIKVKNQVIVITSTVVSMAYVSQINSSRSPPTSITSSRTSSLTRPTSSSRSPVSPRDSRKLNGYKIKKSNNKLRERRQSGQYEIIEQNAVECKSWKLQTLCTLLQNICSQVLDCKEKNMVLQSIDFVL